MKSRITIYFTGGGTGGHVFPGIAVAQEWSARFNIPMEQLLWIGSGKQLERDIVGRFKMKYKAISSGKLRRYFDFRNFFDLFKIGIGFIQIFFFLLFKRPTVIFSKGGYVSVPPCIAAKLLRIPFITHESDMTPGLATRINSRFSTAVLTAYEETTAYIRKGIPCKAVGNPVRSEIFNGDSQTGKKLANVANNKKIVLVLGGSLGAANLNKLVFGAAPLLQEEFHFIHQVGEQGMQELSNKEIPVNLTPVAFIGENLPHFLACADLVVSRAGAGTLWENLATNNLAILIPLGTASSRGDQIVNAQYFLDKGLAVVLKEEETDSAILANEILSLLSDKKNYAKIKKTISEFTIANSAKTIVNEILHYSIK